MVIAIPSFAVTEREMELARTMAAKHYLRYANNGSDYLDKLNPSSMSELQKELKAKEKENIKSFNAVAVPKDYASWDKAKLVDYWSNTFFKSPGLKEDGKKCLGILGKNLKKINVGAPAPAEPAKPAKADDTAKNVESDKAAANASKAAPSEEAQQSVEEAGQKAETPEVLDAISQADAGLLDEQPKRSSNTGWYVAILVVLVGVVIWLVMYASKSMKETGGLMADRKAGEQEVRETKRAAKEEQNKMREQYASSLAAKNDEIKQLRQQCESLEAELDSVRKELAREQSRKTVASETDGKVRVQKAPVQESHMQPAASETQARQTALPPVVYLGYVNQRGLFVKASRSLNADTSVFRMDIPDGHHGTFMVASDPSILDRLLSDTALWLGGGCVIENPEDADIATEIVTVAAGEAIFADNSCRVIKKARIKFI